MKIEFASRFNLIAAVACCLLGGPAVGEEIRDYYAEPGINPFQTSINQNFSEHIDPFSGTLQLHYTDIVVPGPAGFDIIVNRSYTNLQNGDLGFRSPVGVGWTMHFGRIVVPAIDAGKICQHGVGATYSTAANDNPSFERPDGGRELLVGIHSGIDDGSTDTNVLITKSNWTLACTAGGAPYIVTDTNGTKYTMGHLEEIPLPGDNEKRWWTSHVEDVHGNYFDITYGTESGYTYIEEVTANDGRAVDFTYTGTGIDLHLDEISSNSQVWKYIYEAIPNVAGGYYQLKTVQRPEPGDWHYTYFPSAGTVPESNQGNEYSLRTATYPNGGHIEYEYNRQSFDSGFPLLTTVVSKKTVSGHEIENGIWDFTYEPGTFQFLNPETGVADFEDPDIANGFVQSLDRTTVDTPNAQLRYYHYGVQSNAKNWAVGLLAAREVRSADGTTVIEQVVNDWQGRTISEENYSHGSRPRASGPDPDTLAPLLERTIHWRDRALFETAYGEYDDYGNPGLVTELTNYIEPHIPAQKITHYTYFDGADLWIVNRVKNETLDGIVQCGTTASECAPQSGTISRVFDPANGNLLSEDRYGAVTSYTYHPLTGDLHTVTDPEMRVTTLTDYVRGIAKREDKPLPGLSIFRDVNPTGTIKSVTNGRGFTTHFTYDGLNRLKTIDYPRTPDVVDVSVDWLATSRTLERGDYQQVDHYDGFGRIIETIRSDIGDPTVDPISLTMKFDALGQKTFESYPNSTDGTHFHFDELGRVVRIDHVKNHLDVAPTDPPVASRHFQYSHLDLVNIVRETSERGNVTQHEYLSYGSPDGNKVLNSVKREVSASAPDVVTRFKRNLLGQIYEIAQGEIDPAQPDQITNPRFRDFKYDTRYFLVEETHPETGTTVFGRDNVGNMISRQVGASGVTYFDYDDLNRLDLIRYPAAGTTPDVDFGYDENDNLKTVTKEIVRGEAAEAGFTQWSYGYDENENLISELLTVDEQQPHGALITRSMSLGYGYDNLDHLERTTYPNGTIVEYLPDALGLPTKAGNSSQDFAQNVTYHPNGNLHTYDAPNGISTIVTLNPRLFPETIVAGNALSDVVNLTYEYDPSGNVETITDIADPAAPEITGPLIYDGIDRLVGAPGPWGAGTIDYDAHGNIEQKTIGADDLVYDYTPFGGRSNRLAAVLQGSAPWINFDYDDYGNVRQRNTEFFDYDDAGNLERARLSSGLDKTYLYDGNNRMVREERPALGKRRYLVYSKSGHLLHELDPGACTAKNYIRLGTVLVAREDTTTEGGSGNDSDADGLDDCQEAQLGTDPANPDTDNDGLFDGAENTAGTSPHIQDTDGDDLNDDVEVGLGTDPLAFDTDHDGIGDGDEVNNGLDPRNSGDAIVDSDEDQFSNLQEALAGTDPFDALQMPTAGSVGFAYDAGADIRSDAAISADGTIYFGTDDGKLHALYPDGTSKPGWPVQLSVGGEPIVSAPAIGADGTVYVGSNDNFVYAVNPDGTQKTGAGLNWPFQTLGDVEGSPAIGPDGSILIGSDDGNFYALNENGTEKWANPYFVGSAIESAAAVDISGQIYFGANDGDLYALSENGDLVWRYGTPSLGTSSPAIDNDGVVYFGSDDNYVYAINPDGTRRWRTNTGADVASSPVIGSDGTIYVGDIVLHSLNPVDGQLIWTHPTITNASVAIGTGGTVYAGTWQNGGEIRGIRSDTSPSLKWPSVSASGQVRNSISLGRDGTLYVGDEGGTFYAVIDNEPAASDSPWPVFGRDTFNTGSRCVIDGIFHGNQITDDQDSDGIPDCIEAANGLQFDDASDASSDPDNDQLSNLQEYIAGTRFFDDDTDDDLLLDGEELAEGTNPLVADTDHDGVPDGMEVAHGFDPLTSGEGHIDSDDDGFSNREEALTGTNPFDPASVPANGTSAWTFEPPNGGELLASPAIGQNGDTYIASTTGHVYAIWPDGILRWTFPTTDGAGIQSSPTVDVDGSIYFASMSGIVYALDPDGSKIWGETVTSPSSTSYELSSSIAAEAGGPFLYFYDSGSIWKLRKSDGAVIDDRQKNNIQSDNWKSSPAIDSNGNVLLAVRSNSESFQPPSSPSTGVQALLEIRPSLSLSNGWGYVASNGESSSVAIGEDGTVFSAAGAQLRALDPNGTLLWTRTIATQGSNTALKGAPAIGADGTVYVFTFDGDLYAINPQTGDPVWPAPYSGGDLAFESAPAVAADGTIVFGTKSSFHAVTAQGSLKWDVTSSFGNNFKQFSTPLIDGDGMVLVASGSTLHAFVDDSKGPAESSWPMFQGDPQRTGDIDHTLVNYDPIVAITDPINDQTLSADGSITLVATAADVEDGILTSSVVWSSDLDGGLASGGSAQATLTTVGTHVITASVSDSDLGTGQASVTVIVEPANPNLPPAVAITSPSDGSQLESGVLVNFSATAADPEDGDIGSSLSWTSDIDGPIGVGATFDSAVLSVNTHTITATTTDSGGLSGSDSISLTITPANTAPSVSISAPADASSFIVGDTVTFSGTASDPEDGVLDAQISWTSDQDGAIGSGPTVNTSGLSENVHVISATVIDAGGLSATGAISITLNPNDLPTLSIIEPATNSNSDLGSSLAFTGTANDVQDGDISSDIIWLSDRNGTIGTGGSITSAALEAGTHTITARITDSHGGITTKAVTVTVVDNVEDLFPAQMSLDSLSAGSGFRVFGASADNVGASVSSIGDLNGDGYFDLAVGAPTVDSAAGSNVGGGAVIFGTADGFEFDIDVATLTGTKGFRYYGAEAGGKAGTSVSGAGDFNGDGLADLIIGAPNSAPGGVFNAGSSYLLFGSTSPAPATLELSALSGVNGFRLNAPDPHEKSGSAVSGGGDINGDGYSDVIIGAPEANASSPLAGATYVVFGNSVTFPAVVDYAALDGTNGFQIDGAESGDISGVSVSSAGDYNDDGFADVLIGAWIASPATDRLYAGESYVVFGAQSGFSANVNVSTLDGSNGFQLNGIDGGDGSGWTVSGAGDINGDGLGDILIGAPFANEDGPTFSDGEAFVVFGKRSGTVSAEVELSALTGADGFRVFRDHGIGLKVAALGDINNDGYGDIFVSGNTQNLAGAYVIFGKADGFPATLDLATLDGTNGFVLVGAYAGNNAGGSATYRDINGDGIDDIVVGSIGMGDDDGAYVIFGKTVREPQLAIPETMILLY